MKQLPNVEYCELKVEEICQNGASLDSDSYAYLIWHFKEWVRHWTCGDQKYHDIQFGILPEMGTKLLYLQLKNAFPIKLTMKGYNYPNQEFQVILCTRGPKSTNYLLTCKGDKDGKISMHLLMEKAECNFELLPREVEDNVIPLVQKVTVKAELGGNYRHKKRGTYYRVVAIGRYEDTMETNITYVGIDPATQAQLTPFEDNTWTRKRYLFEDGRYERVIFPSTGRGGFTSAR